MSGRAHRARRDTSEPEVIEAFEKLGYKVWKIAQRGKPDLIVLSQRLTLTLVECKTGSGKHRETQDWEKQGWPVVTLRTAEQVFTWHFGEQTGIAR